MTDFLLQKSPGRNSVYRRPPGIWFSKDLNKWMVTDPHLIREAIACNAFSVPSYDVSQVTQKLGLDLSHWNELRKWLPLAVEGSQHRALRELFARHIARTTRGALARLDDEMSAKEPYLLDLPSGKPFCLYANLIRPIMMQALLKLSDLEVPLDKVEGLPRLFDDCLSLRQRRGLDELIGQITERQDPALPLDERRLRVAVLTLSVNTLLGSVGLTLFEHINGSEGRKLSELDWSADLIRTALPLIEKVALQDATLGGQKIRAGQSLRLFIESEGIAPDGHYQYSDLFFSTGSHKCVGMSFSKQVWSRFRGLMGRITRPLRVLEFRERGGDYVFNYPELIMVQFDD